MATSTRQFNIELSLQHLEEASFLYQQRLSYLHDPEISWPDLASWEERFEAHIDALVVGNELAMEVCRRRADEGDAGERHAALLVFCRHQRKADVFALLESLDPSDEDSIRAVSQALRSEAPAGWRDDLLRLFESDRAHLTRPLADVIGYRRFPFEEQLLRKLADQPKVGTAEIAWALGRVGTQKSVPALFRLLDDEPEPTISAAAIALLRLGDERLLERAMREATDRPWARRVLGIGGSSRAVPILLNVLKTQPPDTDTVRALGTLGDLGAVLPLIDLLDDELVGATAAVALNTITGASLYGNTFVPEKFDIDELSDEEREAFERDGTVPTRHGKPYGNVEHGAVRDQTIWRSWLDANKQHFKREYRWRMGQPYGPSALHKCLRCVSSPYDVRTTTYEELVARYRLDEPFEVELRVQQQFYFLSRIGKWSEANMNLTPGEWYFKGQLQAR